MAVVRRDVVLHQDAKRGKVCLAQFTKAVEAKQVAQQDAERARFVVMKADQVWYMPFKPLVSHIWTRLFRIDSYGQCLQGLDEVFGRSVLSFIAG